MIGKYQNYPYPDDGVGVSDGPAVGGVEVGHGVGADLHLPHLAQLVLGLNPLDPVHSEPSLHVVQDAEVLSGLLDLDDVHEPSGEPEQDSVIKELVETILLGVGADLAVNLDQSLLQDGLNLLGGQGVLQTVPEVK